jgi:flavoprotein
MPKVVIFFGVSLIRDGKSMGQTYISRTSDEVLKWYESMVGDHVMFDHIADDLFRAEYDSEDMTTEEIAVENEMIADPDDDGNYPLVIENSSGKVEFLVVGDLHDD